jgi:cysteine synthase
MDGRVDGVGGRRGHRRHVHGRGEVPARANPDVQCVIVEPQGSILKGGEAGPHEVEGIGASSFIPPVLDMSLATTSSASTTIRRSTWWRASRRRRHPRRLVRRRERHRRLEVARRLGRGKRVVTLIPDASERYMSKGIYSRWRKVAVE